jgi:hypothetical protein
MLYPSRMIRLALAVSRCPGRRLLCPSSLTSSRACCDMVPGARKQLRAWRKHVVSEGARQQNSRDGVNQCLVATAIF